ncbi:PAS domain-containing transcriptional regulator [Roseospira marina]|uniref:PAS domain-containing transcriptional regulator n=1 Tax=Roseospira marina TaxID=140057 RepID=A0A5M6IB50_9PROT|nr:PAS domain-containing transcriptional regulator [Roseospira marina]KAA5604949.1 PAS domain-containing transcriptional regulator [Roseospira marina]MBB4315053.1 hypothetical protein [Roseospira marina]MBB5088053.1 hypothetical protein [Roseospira marina]
MTETPTAPAPPDGPPFEYRLQRTPVGVVITDASGRIRSVNPMARRLLRTNAHETWEGVPLLDLHPASARPKIRWLIDTAQDSAEGEAALVITIPMGSLVVKATRLGGAEGVCLMFHALGDAQMGEPPADDAHLLKLPLVRGPGRVTSLIDVDAVASLSAQGHYAEARTLHFRAFCPRSLADLERRLDPRLFVRVHRGHLVNLRHVRAAEHRDGRLCLRLADADETLIPVSRGKVGLVRRLLAV